MPLTLRFPDAALEREWWAWHAAEQRRVLRGGVVVMAFGASAFAAIDLLLWPAQLPTLLLIRAAMLLLLAPAIYAFFAPGSSARMARSAQEWMLYVCAVLVLGLGAISWVVFPSLTEGRAYGALLALNALLCGLYGATGLRVLYAGALCVLATGGFVLGMALSYPLGREMLVTLVGFGVGTNAVGLALSRGLERSGRVEFLRARELAEEQRRSDALLLNVMPQEWAARLSGGSALLDRVPDAAVLFATVTGFGEEAAARRPLAAVALLDDVVACLDEVVLGHGAERIKTVGATYMAAVGVAGRGLGDRGLGDPAARAGQLALDLLSAVEQLSAQQGVSLGLRVGLAVGPLVVGVIGRSTYAFDCWGDTVNTASRLDSAGEPGRVHVLQTSAERLRPLRVEPRGVVELKGKGPTETAWLIA